MRYGAEQSLATIDNELVTSGDVGDSHAYVSNILKPLASNI